MKIILKKHLPSLVFFYRYLRYRLFLLLIFSIIVGLLDGLGLAMFLPLLQFVADSSAQATNESMGNLAFLLDVIVASGLQVNLTTILLTMLVFFIFKGIAKWLESYLSVIYQQYFISKMRIENINLLADYSYYAFVTSDAGAIQNTLSTEVGRVVQGYRTYTQILQQGVLVLSYTGLAFLANSKFALLVLLGGVLTNFLFGVLYRQTKLLSKRYVKSSHLFEGLLIQKVAFFKYLKATGSIQVYAENLKRMVYEIEDSVRKMGILNSIMAGVREPMMMMIVVATILIQVNILGGSLSTIILSLLFFYRSLSSLTGLQTSYNRFLSFSGSIINMQAFIADLKVHRSLTGKHKYLGIERVVELNNLSFGYVSDNFILKDINLSLFRNETVALVGESGSGKTTLMNLLSGLLQPSSGTILIDGKSTTDIDINSLQKKIGYITQEPVIFDDTIFNNVTFWAEKTEFNINCFWNALEKARISDFVKTLSNGENARLGNNGINLSGGQKQRISIARELYKKVDFLFMDEATSSLDSETERMIQMNIDQLKGQYTILIIAHRLSTIKNADQVVILKEGRIDIVGKYDQLIKQSVLFKRMIELQEV